MNSFDDFFSGGTVKPVSVPVGSAMVIIDLSNLIFRAIYGSEDFKKASQVSVDIIRHMAFNILGRYRKMFSKEDYPEFVLAFDGGKLWRNEVFPLYKANRKVVDPDQTQREKDLNEAVGAAFGVLKNELLASSPFTTVISKGAEADDIMGVLAQERSALGLETLIVTGDKDMKQLLRLPHVKLWSPNVKPNGGFVKMTPDEAEEFLFDLIFKGDGGDGVPGIKSPDNTFFPVKIKQPAVYAKETEVWKKGIDIRGKIGELCSAFSYENYFNIQADQRTEAEEKEFVRLKMLQDNYLRNRSMVDLFWIPEPVRQKILEAYEEDRSCLQPRKMRFYLYLTDNNLRQHLSNIQHFV